MPAIAAAKATRAFPEPLDHHGATDYNADFNGFHALTLVGPRHGYHRGSRRQRLPRWRPAEPRFR